MAGESIRDFEGRLIRITEERLGHIARHHGLDVNVAEIRKALEAPGLVVESRVDPDARLYYARREHGRFEVVLRAARTRAFRR